MKKYTVYILVLLIISMLLTGCSGETPTGRAVDVATEDKVKLDFYVMSQCPYGTQVEDAIYPVLGKLDNDVDFNLHFISTDLGNGEFKSLHGEPETNGNIVQLCAAKYNPDKYMDMIVCQNKNAREIPDNWEQCAKDNNLDVEKIRTCYEGDEGKELHSENIKLANSLGISASPTWLANNRQTFSGIDAETVKTNFCAANKDLEGCENTLSSDTGGAPPTGSC